MTRALRLFLGILVGSVLLSGALSAPAYAKKDPAKTITDGIICPCSCGEILTGFTCETGKAMRAYVDAEVKGGKTKDQIEAALVSQYGEVILGAPKAKGFNLLVWAAPVVATVLGLLIASFVLVRWRRQNQLAAPAAPPADGPGAPFRNDPDARDAALRARAEEEYRRLQE
jgi:cytochrome c-type biogenesis protein CcmH/NrfF